MSFKFFAFFLHAAKKRSFVIHINSKRTSEANNSQWQDKMRKSASAKGSQRQGKIVSTLKIYEAVKSIRYDIGHHWWCCTRVADVGRMRMLMMAHLKFWERGHFKRRTFCSFFTFLHSSRNYWCWCTQKFTFLSKLSNDRVSWFDSSSGRAWNANIWRGQNEILNKMYVRIQKKKVDWTLSSSFIGVHIGSHWTWTVFIRLFHHFSLNGIFRIYATHWEKN